MTKAINLLAWSGWILALIGIPLLIWLLNRYTSAEWPFQYPKQHNYSMQCQYPTRPLVNGQCDNSDPCDPETIKDPQLHGNCRDALPAPVLEPQPYIGPGK